jgi:hypothetical protein
MDAVADSWMDGFMYVWILQCGAGLGSSSFMVLGL